MQLTDKINAFNCDNMKFMKDIPDGYYELAIVDIEYGIGASKPNLKPNIVTQKNGKNLNVKQSNYTAKDWDFKLSSKDYLKELFRVSQSQIIFGGNYYGLPGGYLVWDKLNNNSDQFDCEMAWLSFSNRTDLVYYMWSGMFQGEKPSKNIKEALSQIGNKSLNEVRIHPTQKPVALLKWILQKYAKPNDKIIDTHGGSFSLAIACHDMGFELDICELEKDYFDDAVKRVKNHVSQLSLFDPEELVKQK